VATQQHRGLVAPQDLLPVDGRIPRAAVRILRDHDAQGADELAPVQRVPERRGKLADVHLGPLQDVLLAGGLIDHHWR
jgi:hypothetical protein